MSLSLVGIIGLITLVVVLFVLGLPVGFTMGTVGFLGFAYVISYKSALAMVGSVVWTTFSQYGLMVIPLFALMGFLAFNSGIGEKLYKTAYTWLGHLRGGLAIATIGADEFFAAICGSNTATVATMGAVALPQMDKYNYDPRLSSGTVITGGTLGSVMPPSVTLIIIGLQTEQSIVKLFLGGILPAVLLGILFVVTIMVICRVYPEYGPAGPKTSVKDKIKSLKGIIEALIIFVLVIGGLYAGIFTPTEAGAVGAFLTFLVAITTKKLGWRGIGKSLLGGLKVGCMVFILIAGGIIFGRFLAVTKLPFVVADFAVGLPVSRYIILTIVLLIYLIGGSLIDALAFLVLTIPIFFPLAMALNFDPIWMSILMAMMTTLGAITPPVGVNVFVAKAMVPEISLATMFKSAAFFLVPCIICVIILVIFPEIVLIIPRLLH